MLLRSTTEMADAMLTLLTQSSAVIKGLVFGNGLVGMHQGPKPLNVCLDRMNLAAPRIGATKTGFWELCQR